MRQFQVSLETSVPVLDGTQELVRQAVIKTLTCESHFEENSLTLLLTDEQKVRALNLTFLGEDKATDVLSFPTGDATPGTEGYLGDIAISVPTARKQATKANHPLEDELQLLAVHATLHLLGFDHAESDEKQKMWQAQQRILTELGIPEAAPI